MAEPTPRERVALLDLLRAVDGSLGWTGPIPYDAIAARWRAAHPDEAEPVEPAA